MSLSRSLNSFYILLFLYSSLENFSCYDTRLEFDFNDTIVVEIRINELDVAKSNKFISINESSVAKENNKFILINEPNVAKNSKFISIKKSSVAKESNKFISINEFSVAKNNKFSYF